MEVIHSRGDTIFYGFIHFQQDTQGRDLKLRYFRDVDGREVDFVITEDLNPLYLIEIKWKDAAISKGLKYLKKRFPQAEAYQVSAQGEKDYLTMDGIRVMPALRFFSGLAEVGAFQHLTISTRSR